MQKEITTATFWQVDLNYLLAPPRYVPFYTSWVRRNDVIWKGQNWDNTADLEHVVSRNLLHFLSDGIVQLIFNAGIDFEPLEAGANPIEFGMWAETRNLWEKLAQALGYALESGASQLSLYKQGNKLKVRALPFTKYFANTNEDDEIISTTNYIDLYFNEGELNKQKTAYGLCEERFYDKGIPYKRVKINQRKEIISVVRDERPKDISCVEWKYLDGQMKSQIARDYPEIAASSIIDQKVRLPYLGLGSEIIKFKPRCKSYRELSFVGECLPSMLWRESLMWDYLGQWEFYELAASKAKVMLPDNMINRSAYSKFKDFFEQNVIHRSGIAVNGDAKPEKVQFDLRIDQCRAFRQYILEDCAAILNMSSSQIASFLSGTTRSLTESEIIAEQSKGESFIDMVQMQLRKPINRLLKTICRYYGIPAVGIKFLRNTRTLNALQMRSKIDELDRGYTTATDYVEQTSSARGYEKQIRVNQIELMQILKARQQFNQAQGKQDAYNESEKPEPEELSVMDKTDNPNEKQSRQQGSNEKRNPEKRQRL